MDSAPIQRYAGSKAPGFASMMANVAKRAMGKKRAAKFKRSYQAPAVGGSSFTGPGSAGGGIGG